MNKIYKEDINKILEDKYLSYAISTIISRSLPDLRDGLKPVHRRIIYSMYELNSKPDSAFKKSARIVGDVMGKFHPHGDQAIYDSLVRMAQEFSIRYPLIEGQGNFGNIDGDNPAAMRYTEARLNKNSNYLLHGLEENAVDYINNYDGQNKEPSVLPALLPNILLNGATGIAVGMATNIPSHNIIEITKATIELIKNNNLTNKKLLNFIKGPDLPTGGEINIDNENLNNIYNKGKGNFIIKSRWRKVSLSKGQYLIEVFEIPYQINKNKIIENIAKLIKDKKIPIEDIWDESDANIRIIIKPKNRNIEPKKLMDVLFKFTDLSTKFHCNFNVLVDGKIPKLLGLKEILINFINYRKSIVKRIAIFNIDKIKLRIEILSGYLIVYKNLDKIIKIIRNSKDPKKDLKKKFKLKERQIISILEMKLRSLRKIEEKDAILELKSLKKELIFLNKLIKNKKELDKYLINQFESYLEKFKSENFKRKTIVTTQKEINTNITTLDEFRTIENITLACSIKDNLKVYKGHIDEDKIIFNSKEKNKFSLKLKNNEQVLIFNDDGKIYTLDPNLLPGGNSNGTNLSFFVNIKNFSKIVSIFKFEKDSKYLLISKFSKGFIYKTDDQSKTNKTGKKLFNLKKNDKLFKVLTITNDYIAIVSSLAKLLIFNVDEIPYLTKGSGVILQKIKNGEIKDAKNIDINEGLEWVNVKQIKKLENLKPWVGKRSQVGKKVPKKFKKDLKF